MTMRTFCVLAVSIVTACVTSGSRGADPVAALIHDLREIGFPPADVRHVYEVFSPVGGLHSVDYFKLGGRELAAQGLQWRSTSGGCTMEFEPPTGGPAQFHALRAACGWRNKQDACEARRQWLVATGVQIFYPPCGEGTSFFTVGANTITTDVFRSGSEWRLKMDFRAGERLISTHE